MITRKSWFYCLPLALCVLLFAGCTFPPHIYRIDIEQGNILEESKVKQLKLGMTKEQVQDLLGTCQLPPLFNANRWDYYYSFVSGTSTARSEKHVVLIFKNNRLIEIDHVLDESCD